MGFAVLSPIPVYDGPPSPIAIYVLVDPRDGTIRYVGQTDDLQSRLRRHLADKRAPPEKREWIADLKRNRLRPFIVVVARAESWNADELEREHIEHFGALGDLYNIGPGRPSKGTNALHGRIQIKMTEDEERLIRKLAAKLGGTSSTEGRKLFLEWLGKHGG